MSQGTFSTNEPTGNGARRDAPTGEFRDERSTESRGGNGFSFGNIGNGRNRPTMGGISDAVLNVFMKAFEKAGGEDDPALDPQYQRKRFELQPMGASAHTNSNPALLIGLPTVKDNKNVVMVYLLIFENEQGLTYRPVTDRGEHYDSIILPEDMLTKRYYDLVKTKFKHRGDVELVGSQVVPTLLTKDLQLDKDNTDLIAPLFDNAFNAICTHYENTIAAARGDRTYGARITPASLGKGQRLEKTYDYSGTAGIDTGRAPVRSDIRASLYLSSPIEGEDSQYYRTEISEVRVGVDFYVEEADAEEYRDRGFARRRNSRDRDFDPFLRGVLNVNSIIPTTPDVPYTLESVLLNLDMVTQLTNDYRWVAALRPRPGNHNQLLSKLADFPLLNPDPAFRGSIKDLPVNLSDSDLMDYMAKHVHPDVATAITIPTSAAQSWVLSFFNKLANRPTDRKLLDVLARAGDTLTNGAFSERMGSLLNHGDNIVRSIRTRMLLGTWVDENGVTRDLREWNPTALASLLGDKNGAYDLVMDYHDTFDIRDEHSIDFYLSKRAEILTRNVRGVRIFGAADQNVLYPQFLRALSDSIADAGLDAVNVSADGLVGRGRHESSYSSAASYNLGHASRRDDRRNGRGRERHDIELDTKY